MNNLFEMMTTPKSSTLMDGIAGYQDGSFTDSVDAQGYRKGGKVIPYDESFNDRLAERTRRQEKGKWIIGAAQHGMGSALPLMGQWADKYRLPATALSSLYGGLKFSSDRANLKRVTEGKSPWMNMTYSFKYIDDKPHYATRKGWKPLTDKQVSDIRENNPAYSEILDFNKRSEWDSPSVMSIISGRGKQEGGPVGYQVGGPIDDPMMAGVYTQPMGRGPTSLFSQAFLDKLASDKEWRRKGFEKAGHGLESGMAGLRTRLGELLEPTETAMFGKPFDPLMYDMMNISGGRKMFDPSGGFSMEDIDAPLPPPGDKLTLAGRTAEYRSPEATAERFGMQRNKLMDLMGSRDPRYLDFLEEGAGRREELAGERQRSLADLMKYHEEYDTPEAREIRRDKLRKRIGADDPRYTRFLEEGAGRREERSAMKRAQMADLVDKTEAHKTGAPERFEKQMQYLADLKSGSGKEEYWAARRPEMDWFRSEGEQLAGTTYQDPIQGLFASLFNKNEPALASKNYGGLVEDVTGYAHGGYHDPADPTQFTTESILAGGGYDLTPEQIELLPEFDPRKLQFMKEKYGQQIGGLRAGAREGLKTTAAEQMQLVKDPNKGRDVRSKYGRQAEAAKTGYGESLFDLLQSQQEKVFGSIDPNWDITMGDPDVGTDPDVGPGDTGPPGWPTKGAYDAWVASGADPNNAVAYGWQDPDPTDSITVPTGGCFIAGTGIDTVDDIVPIEILKVGDMVRTYDLKDKKHGESKITKTYKHEDMDGYLIINGVINTTVYHPFYSDGDWIKAGDLSIGDKILHVDGAEHTIDSIDKVDDKIDVYNIEVDDMHNYFAEGYLVHNK